MRLELSLPAVVLALSVVFAIFAQSVGHSDAPSETPVTVKVVQDGESVARPEACRGTLIGPGINQPDPFPGYRGMVGWESPVVLKNGDWLVGFNAGYWHASFPTPFGDQAQAEFFAKIGMPLDVKAPRGGKAMIIRSTDHGKTWSKPTTLMDTPWDDRHPSFLELPSGTILCSTFVMTLGDYKMERKVGHWSMITRSTDGGHKWEKPRRVCRQFLGDESDGPMVLSKDGSVYMAIDGKPKDNGEWQVAVLRSTDEGLNWKLISIVKTDHSLYEPSIAELPDGKMVLIARPEGDIAFSSDHGRTWTKPVSFGMRLFAPSLEVLKDGTLLCIHGSYGAGGLRVIFSRDGGHTWIAPNAKYGFLIDHSYGYGKATQLRDGTLFLTYLNTPGIDPVQATSNSIWCIRMAVRSHYSGIDLLPAPNRK